MRAVEVWTLALNEAPDLSRVLSQDERERAARLRHDKDRRQFVAARGGLRLVLGRTLGVPPESLAFEVAGAGKPGLAGSPLRFNVSHSYDAALIALSDAELGVDVELMRPRDIWPDMARRYFTPYEAERIGGETEFYAVWTRKEAFLKALGLGLSHGLERFSVSVPPDDPARILHIDGDAAKGAEWTLAHLEPLPGYVGALAIEGPATVRLRKWEWRASGTA
ncbi:MAG: 4'-phosphopantetheinyl transferase superfamily protein [Gemmataceae bacterium]|nr:4'-phosphopantetheinyl transferase superfamily protein [Gemmataceae bacterium]